MSTALPQGEKTRRAVKWISATLEVGPDLDLYKLVQEAISKFDLNPLESEMLMQFYREK